MTMLRFALGALFSLATTSALAQPASCAGKFIGTWVYPGGTTVVAPGGMAYPKCPMCVPTQTWTCRGNTYLFSNSGPPGQFSATLTPDGKMAIGSTGIVATRVGGAARPTVNAPTPAVRNRPTVTVNVPRVSPPEAQPPMVGGNGPPAISKPSNPTVQPPKTRPPTVTENTPVTSGPSNPTVRTPQTPTPPVNAPTPTTPQPSVR